MPTLSDIMAALRAKATEKTRSTYIRHGAQPDHTLGVSNADMKLIAKTIKKQQALACELYDTGIFEARYLAGLVADGALLSKKQLQSWASAAAHMPMVSEHTVPWVTTENSSARELAMEWISSNKEHVAAAGWRSYAGLVTVTADDLLDLIEVQLLLNNIPAKIKTTPDRVRSAMDAFIISVGSYVGPLRQSALTVADQIGEVSVDVSGTACKVPLAAQSIKKMLTSGKNTLKRKTIRC